MGKVRYALVNPDNPRSLATRMRIRRWEVFSATFPAFADAKILDLGGGPRFWRTAPDRPAHVTTVNLSPAQSDEPWLHHIVGDACELTGLGRFDLVFSNSLIEHVGGHERRRRLADVIVAAAPCYWVQTPYRYFPIEPHFVVPGMQFMPLGTRAVIAGRWHAGPWHIPHEQAVRMVEGIELIGIRQLRSYFPDARIETERLAGLPKSIIAVAS